jgi:oxygen-independent coproporphyrinogen III oxidase
LSRPPEPNPWSIGLASPRLTHVNLDQSQENLRTASPYQSYVYGYPHKTAYRPLPRRSLSSVWANESRDALFLYIHIPFCEMRCGFCNLFTTVSHSQDFVSQYLATLQRQAQQVKAALGSMGQLQFARFALGGGTPTQLDVAQLEQVLDLAEGVMGADLQAIPGSVEVSPETATLEKLQLLKQRGATRMSIGVQSFIDSEVLAVQRRQTTRQVQATLARIQEVGFPILNLDLIYGLPGQTLETWLYSLKTALQFQPAEIYLYPLYVRPLTGLGLSDREWDDIRIACYCTGRDFLLANGYIQVSMRMFRANQGLEVAGPVYCCQADGMVGLGCGARSYTQSLHYANDYAVGAGEVRGILERYIASANEELAEVNYGFELDQEEQQRRFVLLSLLSETGLDLQAYAQRFASQVLQDFPQLSQLIVWELAKIQSQVMRLTPAGLERSDAIGPWLFSRRVQGLMQSYSLK